MAFAVASNQMQNANFYYRAVVVNCKEQLFVETFKNNVLNILGYLFHTLSSTLINVSEKATYIFMFTIIETMINLYQKAAIVSA